MLINADFRIVSLKSKFLSEAVHERWLVRSKPIGVARWRQNTAPAATAAVVIDDESNRILILHQLNAYCDLCSRPTQPICFTRPYKLWGYQSLKSTVVLR